MRARVGVLAVAAGLMCCSVAFGTSIPVRGNSSYGTGTGFGSWNLADGSTIVDNVTIAEQTVCSAENVGQSCPSGGEFTYLFEIESSISNPVVSLSGLSGDTGFGVMACNESSGNGPGPLCTDSTVLAALGCSSTACTGVTYDGTNPVFTVTGDGDGLAFYVEESGPTSPSVCINGVCGAAPTPAPEPSSIGLLSVGLLTLWWRRRANAG
jgi:hypothetical protein